MVTQTRIKQRFDTQLNWENKDIVLLSGEMAIVDCGTQIRFKVGNGLSTFNQLPFVDQTQLKTNYLIANSMLLGPNISSAPYGLAAGAFLSAGANFSQTFGYNAAVLSTDMYAFTWNGDDAKAIGEYYPSHGKGTFNINPLSGIDGFFIGDANFPEIVSGLALSALSDNYEDKVVFKSTIVSALSSAGIHQDTQLSDITLGNILSAIATLQDLVKT